MEEFITSFEEIPETSSWEKLKKMKKYLCKIGLLAVLLVVTSLIVLEVLLLAKLLPLAIEATFSESAAIKPWAAAGEAQPIPTIQVIVAVDCCCTPEPAVVNTPIPSSTCPPCESETPEETPTVTLTPSLTSTYVWRPSPTPTKTKRPPTVTPTPPETMTPTTMISITPTPSATVSVTSTQSITPTQTITPSDTPTLTPSPTATITPTEKAWVCPPCPPGNDGPYCDTPPPWECDWNEYSPICKQAYIDYYGTSQGWYTKCKRCWEKVR